MQSSNQQLAILMVISSFSFAWNGFDKIFTSTSFCFFGADRVKRKPRHGENTLSSLSECYLRLYVPMEHTNLWRESRLCKFEARSVNLEEVSACSWLSMGKTLDIFRMLKSLLVFLPSLKSAEASTQRRVKHRKHIKVARIAFEK